MNETRIIELLVDADISDEIMKKKYAEIVSRRADAKFKSMVKCQILGQSSSKDELSQQITNAINKIYAPEAKRVRKLLSQQNVISSELSHKVKDVSFQLDGIYDSLKNISYFNMGLSFINTGLSLTNLAINLEGFNSINEKLAEIEKKIDSIDEKILALLKYNKEELIKEYRGYIDRANCFYNDINAGESIEWKELRTEISILRNFILQLKGLFEYTDNTIFLLEMINALLPAYAFLLIEYLKIKKKYPFSNEKDLEIFNQILEIYDSDSMFDFLFLTKELHISEVWDIINSQKLFIINNRTQIDDQAELISIFPSERQLCDFEKKLNKIIIEDIQERIPAIAKESSVEEKECQRFFEEFQQRFMPDTPISAS